MRSIIFIGKSGSGKTTLTQQLRGRPVEYRKTQYIRYHDAVIDTPGEYAENASLASALALYAYEADTVGLLLAADDQFSLFPPNITCMVNREVVGIVTRIDVPDAKPERAAGWLRLSGCKKLFFINGKTGEGVSQLAAYLQNKS